MYFSPKITLRAAFCTLSKSFLFFTVRPLCHTTADWSSLLLTCNMYIFLRSSMLFVNFFALCRNCILLFASLEKRRQNLCLKFAKQCTRNEKLKSMFPKNKKHHSMKKRSAEKFVVRKAYTERYRRSAIPNMQRLLNNSENEKLEIFRKIENTVPVNYGLL